MPNEPRLVYSTDPEPERRNDAGSKPVAKPAKGQVLTVGIERKGRGGKTVSIVRGFVGAPAQREALLKQLKTRLGAGGALAGEEIEIQGDQRDRIVEILGEMGHRAKKAGG